jgi:hypothetical protein
MDLLSCAVLPRGRRAGVRLGLQVRKLFREIRELGFEVCSLFRRQLGQKTLDGAYAPVHKGDFAPGDIRAPVT